MLNDQEKILKIAGKLNQTEKSWLLDIISKISEKSYRRAVQQVLTLLELNKIEDWILQDKGYSYRHDKSTKISIGLDGYSSTSQFRLLAEESYLHFLEKTEPLKDDES